MAANQASPDCDSMTPDHRCNAKSLVLVQSVRIEKAVASALGSWTCRIEISVSKDDLKCRPVACSPVAATKPHLTFPRRAKPP